MTFSYDAAIVERFPAVVGGVIHAVGVTNGASPPHSSRRSRRSRRPPGSSTPLGLLRVWLAWRRAFRAFGVDPTGYRSAAEALLRRLTKQGSIPSINSLVDLGNLVSIRYALPVAIFDQRAVTGRTTVRFATGDEAFTDLGSPSDRRPTPAR
jgi:DNA/RNA-binding domain of Phe-tRNA-synthetase-like protein